MFYDVIRDVPIDVRVEYRNQNHTCLVKILECTDFCTYCLGPDVLITMIPRNVNRLLKYVVHRVEFGAFLKVSVLGELPIV